MSIVTMRLLLSIVYLLANVIVCFSLSSTPVRPRHPTNHWCPPKAVPSSTNENDTSISESYRRRKLLRTVANIASLSIVPYSPAVALTTESSSGALSRDQVAELLHGVPTFTIVDKSGVPFMVVGEDAKVTSYLFISYNEASRILKLASKSADQTITESKQKGETLDQQQLTNPWKQARISTVPLDTALAISLQSSGGSLRSYFQIAPSETDIEEALLVTGKDDLEDGKIPLFYYRDYVDGEGKSPLFFSKSQLEAAFRRDNRRAPVPAVQVTELLSVLRLMVESNDNEDVKNLVFVSPTESAKRAKECVKNGGSNAPLVLGERIIVL